MKGSTHALIGLTTVAAANSLVAANTVVVEAGTMAGFIQPHMINEIPAGPVLCAVAAILGALAPDIDAEESTIRSTLGLAGKIFSFVLRLLGVKHRGATHYGVTVLLILVAAFLGWWTDWPRLLGYGNLGGDVGLAFGLGYLSHVLADAMTKHGVPLWWPLPGQFHLLPKPLRIRTGGPVETLVSLLAALALVWLLPDMAPPELLEMIARR